MLSFKDKVVVITGSGGGLGKDYALFFASRGACVVVNDLMKRDGVYAADLVRDEIIKNNGRAVSNYDSVEDGDKIIQTAIQNYGKIDVLINNAGIIRDTSFSKMTDSQWNAVINVHLNGTYKCTKAAWPYFMKQKYGRIINTGSGSGLYGNFGQANYSSAKLGIHGFTQTIAIEGGRKNIFTNTIAPLAATAMTEKLFSDELKNALKSENIVPFVAYLAHEDCQENGSVFELAAGWVSKVRMQRNNGAGMKLPYTPEDVKKNFDKIISFEGVNEYPTSLNDSISKAYETFERVNMNPKL